MTVTIYGIKACDTMKKARAWLDENQVEYTFHDYKKLGIDREHLEYWCAKAGWEAVLNRVGTTFKKLPDAAKLGLDQERAISLMMAQPSMIKRPVLELANEKLLLGFKPEVYGASLT